MKKYISTFLLALFVMVLGTGNANAVLQSNGGTAAKYNVDEWMSNTRKMEALGGAMGLSETLNSNLTASSKSNNIDVHMQKNTEYGALAILSASSYGNPNVIADGKTTTGNVTGVVMKLNKEWVAAGTIPKSNVYINAAGRYKNVYTATYEAKRGDAINETKGWHASEQNRWMDDESKAGLLRAFNGSIFSYFGGGVGSYTAALYEKTWASRAVVVIGEGL